MSMTSEQVNLGFKMGFGKVIAGSLPSVQVMAKANRQTATKATFRSMTAEQMSRGNQG